MSTPPTESDVKPHIDLAFHGDLDALSTRELLALRRVIRSTERHIRRRTRHERRPFWTRFLIEWARVMWVLTFPVIGGLWWLHSAYVGLLLPFWHLWWVQLAWTLLRGLWWPWKG